VSRHRGEWRGCGSLVLVRVLVVTWAPGGNLPPLVAAGSVLARRGHEVQFLASAETSELPKQLGFPVTRYRRSPNPETKVVFESQADVVMALMAGTEVALDARDVLVDLRPDLAIIDCMLPAAIAAARTTGTPTASLVHFLYGLARTQMLRAGGGWTTDLHSLGCTHRALRLAPALDGLAAWEAPEMLLVTAPRWLDIDADTPSDVVYAGPLDVQAGHDAAGDAGRGRPAVLLTFITTVMDGQAALIDRVCQTIAPLDLDAILTLGPRRRSRRRTPARRRRGSRLRRPRSRHARLRCRGQPRWAWNRAARPSPRRATAPAPTRARSGVQRKSGRSAPRRHSAPCPGFAQEDPSRAADPDRHSTLPRGRRRPRHAHGRGRRRPYSRRGARAHRPRRLTSALDRGARPAWLSPHSLSGVPQPRAEAVAPRSPLVLNSPYDSSRRRTAAPAGLRARGCVDR
jgi:hypothetical protein